MKGTVIKRGSRWSVVIDLGRDLDGKRIRKWHSGYRTKRKAEQARIEILSRVLTGLYVAPHKLTVAQWLRDWLEGRVGLAETTTRATNEMPLGSPTGSGNCGEATFPLPLSTACTANSGRPWRRQRSRTPTPWCTRPSRTR